MLILGHCPLSADIPGGCRIKQWHGTDIPAQTSALATLTVSAAVTVSVDLEYDRRVDSSDLTINGGILERCNPRAEGVLEIPAGVTAIKDAAFQDCKYLTAIFIPYSVTQIGKNAFSRCGDLTGIAFLQVLPKSNTGLFITARGFKTSALKR